MKSRFLFPAKARSFGLILLLAGLAFYIYSQNSVNEIFVWHNLPRALQNFTGSILDENFDDEIQLLMVLSGLILLAFSKERLEDEHITQLRSDSLQWAVYVNYSVFAVLIFASYGLGFLMFTMYNVLTLLVFFIIRFRWKIFLLNKALTTEVKGSVS
ncbi:hypothetical protein LX99_04097 [Mucilaginibacter oryzae]|uniref:Uncharacterized protein n=1 Tax=Mucilaginibacter oryzae TaxID=468058 RepID=A0A316H113_9SPHI|nr:hypothetical protein [Mucilaginibacter oryzae]PWK73712.1 hypothetical protein LX99_04097 [Mucilaginibacter oryzae]